MTTSAVGWTCPRCSRGVSPYISVCPCGEDGSAGVTALPVSPLPAGPSIAPYPFPGSSITVTSPLVTTITYGETVWTGVAILNAGKAAA